MWSLYFFRFRRTYKNGLGDEGTDGAMPPAFLGRFSAEKSHPSPLTPEFWGVRCSSWSGFVQTLESPEIKMLRFPGWKTLKKSWNSKVVVLEILLSQFWFK